MTVIKNVQELGMSGCLTTDKTPLPMVSHSPHPVYNKRKRENSAEERQRETEERLVKLPITGEDNTNQTSF
jgi:hypothetical protein